jgi:ABC-type branched-subunit amino acid transport system substrate-binding protein
MFMRSPALLSATALAGMLALGHAAEPGLTAKEVVVGQAAALSGPAAGLGTGMNLGLKAWIAQINAAGGIHGRTLRLEALDDGYEPEKAAEATETLIDQKKAFVLAGYVGTPTAKAAIPVLSEAKVPLIGAFTGAGLLRRDDKTGKPLPWVINLRASYDDETETIVERATKDLGATKVAVFYQNDAFGLAGLSGTEKALKKRGMALAAKGTFERNTVAVKKGLADILAASPDAVVMVGPYKPIAAFLKEARAAGLKSLFATVSFVGTEKLIAEAGAEGEGVVITQVVPSPDDESVPLVKDYRAALAVTDAAAKPGYISLEGYATGRLLGLVLERAGKEPTRAGLVAAAEGLARVDVGGMTATMSADDHQASDAVFVTRITAGKAVPTTSLK